MCGVYIIRNSLRYIISIKDAVYHQGIRLVYHHAFACIEATQVFAYGRVGARLPLTSELDALCAATANRILRTRRKNAVRIKEWRIQTKNAPYWVRFLFGAATQIRTGDLILTKDVLYQLSHSSSHRPYGHLIL